MTNQITSSLHQSNGIQISTTTTAKPTQADLVGNVMGEFGVWQLRTILIIFLCKIPAAWFMACIIFTAPELYPRSEFLCDTTNRSNQSPPWGVGDSTVSADQCYVLDENVNKSVAKKECTKFLYNNPDFYSLVMQFNLLCARDIFLAWSQYWHLFGVLVGGVVATKMMIRTSPRNVLAFGMVLQIICGCVTGYTNDFSMNCAFRCFSAICCALMFTAGQTIFTDITAGKFRLGAIILYDTFWSIGVILLPGLSSFFSNWTHIYLGITFPTLLLILLLQWTPDSPRWLLREGSKCSLIQAEEILRDAASINDRMHQIPSDFREQLRLHSESLRTQPPPADWWDIWKGPRAKIHSVAAHLALAAYIINFMGMLLNIRSFGRNYLVVNTIIMGFSEIVGCFLALHFTLDHNKWKWQWAGVFNIIVGLMGFLGWTFSNSQSMNADVKAALWIILAALSKAGVSFAQSMILACLSELVPPRKKAIFVFSVVTWARVWLLSAPFFNMLKKIDVAMSLSAYCSFSIFGGICLCFILTPNSEQTQLPLDKCSENNKGFVNDEIDDETEKIQTLPTKVWTVSDNQNVTRL